MGCGRSSGNQIHEEDAKLELRPFPNGEEWHKTQIATDRKCSCLGLALTLTHAVAGISDKANGKDNFYYSKAHIAFSSSPSTRPLTLNTRAKVSDFSVSWDENCIAVGNDFCVVAGTAEYNKGWPTSLHIFFSSSSSLQREWKERTIFADPENERWHKDDL